jgi:branched-chain amino acid transport system ATP-binding protein
VSTGVVRVTELEVSFGAVRALRGVSLEIPLGGVAGLVGPNGAGKTTLLNALAGEVPYSGTIELRDEPLGQKGVRHRTARGIIRGFQTVRLLDRETVLTNVLLGRHRFTGTPAPLQAMGWPWAITRERAHVEAALQAMELLGIHDLSSRRVAELSFGHRRLVEVARVLAAEPRVMLLDEPMAGLDAESRTALAERLVLTQQSLGMTMLMVEHDTRIVADHCEWVAVLDAGQLLTSGEPSVVFNESRVRSAYLGAMHA